MNALAQISDALPCAPSPRPAAFPDLPDEAPLAMPDQALDVAPLSRGDVGATPAARRLAGLIATTVLLTIGAIVPVWRLLDADTIGPLDLMIVVLVILLFAWTAFSFLSALAGFIAGARGVPGDLEIDLDAPLPALASRNAVLLPVYNEAPRSVFSRLQAIRDSLDAAGARAAFDVFVLSDSTDPAVQAEEYRLFRRLRARQARQGRVFYRHRAENLARKAGNIADWVRRFGGAYAHMVVLDADSLMEGETLVRLAAAMEREPDVGLIQTAPSIVNRHTLFARTEQFASRLYGPMLARGVAWWSGSEGNYWGHNAIIRVEAFARHAGLPRLAGRKPFGGHIMSHDFVEAALLRRAGWRVHLVSDLGGSYEESPPTLAGLLARDRRWSQGNLQHAQVLWARGLHWISRFHLLRGISAYVVAPLWLLLLSTAVLLPLRPEWGRAAGAAAVATGKPAFDPHAVSAVFAVSIGFLLAPKVLAYIQMLRTPVERSGFGGAALAALSVVVETLISTLVAPLIMISHTRSLAAALAGRDSGWAAQAREGAGGDPEQMMRLHVWDTVIGLALAIAGPAACLESALWMTPVIASLAFAIPLATLVASGQVGRFVRRAGILLTPEETRPPQILVRARAHLAGWPPS